MHDDEDLHDATSSFSQPDLSCTHFRRHYVEAILTVPSLLDIDTGPILVNQDFLSYDGEDSINCWNRQDYE